MKKIKIFNASFSSSLEEIMNEWIQKESPAIEDIKFSIARSDDGRSSHEIYAALVVYRGTI